jgi:hypothetical protein
MATLSSCLARVGAGPRARRQLFNGDAANLASTPIKPCRGSAALTVRAAVGAFGGGSNDGAAGRHSNSWGGHRKQLVEALTQGASLARAPCAWYVDHSSGEISGGEGGGAGGGGSPKTRGIGGGGGSTFSEVRSVAENARRAVSSTRV